MGRDTVAISLIHSGKSLAYIVPLLIGAMEEEERLRLMNGEGPIGLIVVPSRELAQQIYELVDTLAVRLRNYPRVRAVLCMGGTDMKSQLDGLKRGVHILISTPGRLSDLLSKGKVSLDMCKLLVLDEADRLLDLGFEDEISSILTRFQHRPQIVLCSSSIPRDFHSFAAKFLTKPIVVSIARSQLAKLTITQEFEFPRHEEKLSVLLNVMGKTLPPVLIFCENKVDVEEIVSFLQKQGIDALALHGGKEQFERFHVVEEFRKGGKEVLVATDVAAKGLNFAGVKHVINFDMPKEMDQYIQRICRTGREQTGLATTLIESMQEREVLLELRGLLGEAGQRVPRQLEEMREVGEEMQVRNTGECSYCGLARHRKSACVLLQIDTLSTIIEAAEASNPVPAPHRS